jgi:hypothetical protein
LRARADRATVRLPHHHDDHDDHSGPDADLHHDGASLQ